MFFKWTPCPVYARLMDYLRERATRPGCMLSASVWSRDAKRRLSNAIGINTEVLACWLDGHDMGRSTRQLTQTE